MDVSHIIRGRPWQFDKEVIHNGKLNPFFHVLGAQDYIASITRC